MKKQKGFTLIELIIVIAIISLLAMIVTYSIIGAQKKARDTKRIAELSDLGKAVGIYQSMNAGELPPMYAGSQSGGWDTGCLGDTNQFLQELINKGLAKTIPRSNNISDPSGFSYPGAGCYRYRYFDSSTDICQDGHGYGVLYTACESDTCPSGEIVRDCTSWPYDEGKTYAGKDIDKNVYMIFIKGN